MAPDIDTVTYEDRPLRVGDVVVYQDLELNDDPCYMCVQELYSRVVLWSEHSWLHIKNGLPYNTPITEEVDPVSCGCKISGPLSPEDYPLMTVVEVDHVLKSRGGGHFVTFHCGCCKRNSMVYYPHIDDTNNSTAYCTACRRVYGIETQTGIKKPLGSPAPKTSQTSMVELLFGD